MVERLQKLLSQSGVCSRRMAEEYILAGRVFVNGEPAQLGQKADLERDRVTVDGKEIVRPDIRTYLMLYKPRGYVTTLSDEQQRKTVLDLVEGCGVRVWPVGRLDLDSEGLLLLTNDGELTQQLLHPSHQVEKEYWTWVRGDVEAACPLLTSPLCLEGEQLRPAKVHVVRTEGDRTVLSIVIREGKNRQVRRMCAHCGLEVLRLKRVREGMLQLDQKLRPGQWRPLTMAEKHQFGLD